jgi:hypothetical protein
MAHVLCVETVVAELVHHDFVCREIIGRMTWGYAQVHRKPPEKIVYAQKKGGLAYLVAVGPILEVTYRTDCEYELFLLASFCGSADPDDPFKSFTYF